MRRYVWWVFVLCLVAQLGGCLTTQAPAPLETQLQPRLDPRIARIYFLREKGFIASEVGIKVDGRSVGSVDKGLYFFVDKPPGRYRISCVNSVSMDYESDLQAEGGKAYYIGIGIPQVSAPGQNLINQAAGGSSGQQMPATSPMMSGFSGAALYQIDASEGPAIIAQMKPR